MEPTVEGDHLFMTNVIKALDEEGWHITFEYNYKGRQIHAFNPRIDIHKAFEPISSEGIAKWKSTIKRLKKLQTQYDLYVCFSASLEHALIGEEREAEYFWPLHMRRAKNTNICYYDQSMRWAGLTDKKYMGRGGEVYYPKGEHEFVKEYLKPYEDNFIILWGLRGSMWQKAVYPLAEDVCNEFIRRHPETIVFTTGDEFCKKWEWYNPNVLHKAGIIPFRQALLMTRYVDLVIAPETGLGVGAGIFGTPKILFLTSCSLKMVVGNDKNDYSLQSDAWCSPCTRAIYNTDNCDINPETKLPICVDFDKGKILDRMEEVYESRIPRNWEPCDKSVYV